MIEQLSKLFFSVLILSILIITSCGDDEGPENSKEYTVSMAGSTTVSEAAGNVTITVTIDSENIAGTSLTIPYEISTSSSATEGDDFSSLSGSVSIANGQTSATFTVSIIDDSEVESDETIMISLDEDNLPNNISGTPSVTITITDNDELPDGFTAVASVSSTDNTAAEGADNASFTISLDKENTSGMNISINYTVAGTATEASDFDNLSGTASIANGETSASITISITDDSEVESDETIIISLANTQAEGITVNNNASSTTITITDNDELPDDLVAVASISSSDNTATEGTDNASFTISLDQVNTSEDDISIIYEVSGTAKAGQDFVPLSDTAIIAANSQSVTVDVEIVDNGIFEMEETIVITLSENQVDGISIDEAATSTTITITDDEEEPESSIFFGATSGTSLTIDSWDHGAPDSPFGYILVMNTSEDFTDLVNGEVQYASTTYRGYGEQVVYNDASVTDFEVLLLQASETYYFKLYTYNSELNYNNDLVVEANTTASCEISSTTEGQVCFSYSETLRTISSNQLANHDVGNFPNADPTATEVTRELDLTPEYTGTPIYIYDETGGPTPSNDNFYQFGMAINGVEFHPMGLKPWTATGGGDLADGEENWKWQAKVTEEGETDLDAYGAHVTTAGNYHYHGDIVGLADEDGSRHSLIYGFAADGFPIYYKYGYSDPEDPTSSIIELTSSYQLKSGSRTDTGVAGEDYPDGDHDGTYIQDFEYVDGLGTLDECNGRTGVTPEFPDGTYYYVITSEFPVVPNCFYGTPDDDWKIGK